MLCFCVTCIFRPILNKEGMKLDFFKVSCKTKKSSIVIEPEFYICPSKDLMIRGGDFYAIWDEETGLWSKNEYDVARIIDRELMEAYKNMRVAVDGGEKVVINLMANHTSKVWSTYRSYVRDLPDNYIQLDKDLTFANDQTKRGDYRSKRLSYSLMPGDWSAWDELVGTLYSPVEREKIEWAIGSIVAGDSKEIQKMFVFYGDPGSGKSTILNVINMLFDGYVAFFNAKSLLSTNNQFSTESFRNDPLVGIEHDGDMSRIDDNSKLNSIVSHELMEMNEKYKSSYLSRLRAMLFVATNKPVKITDGKAGVLRRLVDINPSGEKLSSDRYCQVMNQIKFQLGAIAYHCLEVYRSLGINYYDRYRPMDMMFKTDVFYNFVEENYYIFSEQDGCRLKQAYGLYKAYCNETDVEYKLPMYRFREELKNYFQTFYPITRVDGKQVRSYYEGFLKKKFQNEELEVAEEENVDCLLQLDCEVSLLDEILSDCKAQYAGKDEQPTRKWRNVRTKLKDLDTKEVHYIQGFPENHIVVDFDLKDENGEKSAELNLREASKWPKTYAEFSKSGKGVHLHYIYDGDPNMLSRIYSEGVEIKVFTGEASLRRRLTKCNSEPIATIRDGLPLKGDKKMVNFDTVQSEKGLRTLIHRNLNKEIHPGTKPSVDFIYKILEDAYCSGLKYDVSDLRQKILIFASGSTNHSGECVKLVAKMKFKSEEPSEAMSSGKNEEEPIIFFDVEVFPNLFLVNWKYAGDEHKCVRMINPSLGEIEELMRHKLVGFNCRRYDNHILYARYLGYSNQQLFELSKKIINGDKRNNNMFGEAYNISYTDVYDFASASNKKSLKKFEIELGIHHQELGLPWDKDVPEDQWGRVAEYCDNDVIATEAVFNHLKSDWVARQILAAVAGGTVNDTTNSLTTKLIFGSNRNPQNEFYYRNLGEPVERLDESRYNFLTGNDILACDFTAWDGSKSMLPYFPGYKFESGTSTYRGEEVGEGGYVYAEPGMYWNVALLDVASMHPSSAIDECHFGVRYTTVYKELKDARVCIKHEDYDAAKKLLGGKLTPFLEDGSFSSKELADALKTAINSVYGLTSAKFPNAFHDPRNVDNIVAKRGALFMIDLKHAVQERGFTVAHIKTDSIKIPNATPEIIQFVMDFGKRYGYTFEHEATYEKMCLVNDAVYIARYAGWQEKEMKHDGWTATGAQFAHPYVFKTLFSREPLEFKDYCETKSATTDLYLDFNEDLEEGEHNYIFVGKVGSFCPVKSGSGGGELFREKNEKYYAVGGTSGYRWKEAEIVREYPESDRNIDMSYFRELTDKSVEAISKYGDFEVFLNEQTAPDDGPPWDEEEHPYPSEEWCPDPLYPNCVKCPDFNNCRYECKIPF